MHEVDLSRKELAQPTYRTVLERAPLGELLASAARVLDAAAGSGAGPDELADAVADTISRRLKTRREEVAAWLDARDGDAGHGWCWVRARLRAWLGHTEVARKAFDQVIERGIGPRVARHLARARLRLEADDAPGACADLREAFRDPASYEEMERGWRLLRRIPEPARPALRRLKIGLLGSSTTQLVAPILELACFRDGIAPAIYEAEYAVHQEILDPASGLRRFGPDVVILATSWRDGNLPAFHGDPDAAVESLVGPLRALWRACRDELRCHVLQHNFDVPLAESAGQLGRAHPGGRTRVLLRANLALLEASGPGLSVVDVDAVAAEVGRARFEDPGLWYLAKQHPATAAIPALVDCQLAQLRALLGLGKKVLVLDLDNTLWGGVVGEDGVHGLKLGAHSPEGEAHAALQRYALELKERGVVLAVCSKNNDADAREPFEQHPEMVLRLADFAAFFANWNDKASNLREIARVLELGLDSFVFLDDNPTERAWVRSQLPEVAVPEIGDDPSHFLPRLQRYRYFEALALTQEDRMRAADYSAGARRSEQREQASSLEDFLRSLEMSAAVGPFDAPNLPRIAQLVNKTNQFNLTTRRYTEQQLRGFAESGDFVTRWFRLQDRFGDNGLIGVILGRKDGGSGDLDIELWLMSCRVLGRRMEEFMLAELLAAARAAGAARLVGRFLPTAKNAMVKDLYPRLGFRRIEGDPAEGASAWALEVEGAPPPEGAALIRRDGPPL